MEYMRYHLRHYNPNRFWKMRAEVCNPNSKKFFLVRLYYYYLIKRSESYNCASMGTNYGKGAVFLSPPILSHGLNGIIISDKAIIGRNVIIRQQVTIGTKTQDEMAPIIGDDVVIGAGAKIIGEIRIGKNAVIGANAVVVHDVPDNCIVGGVPAKIIGYNNNSDS
jgi:serine O-acetyltransferase